MDWVRRRLGIEEGGSAALCAMALLTGNDYHLEGAKGIGMTLAWEAISALLSGATVRSSPPCTRRCLRYHNLFSVCGCCHTISRFCCCLFSLFLNLGWFCGFVFSSGSREAKGIRHAESWNASERGVVQEWLDLQRKWLGQYVLFIQVHAVCGLCSPTEGACGDLLHELGSLSRLDHRECIRGIFLLPGLSSKGK